MPGIFCVSRELPNKHTQKGDKNCQKRHYNDIVFFAWWQLRFLSLTRIMMIRMMKGEEVEHGQSIHKRKQEHLPADQREPEAHPRVGQRTTGDHLPGAYREDRERTIPALSGRGTDHGGEIPGSPTFATTTAPISVPRQQYVPEIQIKDLSQIVLEMLASLNSMHRQRSGLSRSRRTGVSPVMNWRISSTYRRRWSASPSPWRRCSCGQKRCWPPESLI